MFFDVVYQRDTASFSFVDCAASKKLSALLLPCRGMLLRCVYVVFEQCVFKVVIPASELPDSIIRHEIPGQPENRTSIVISMRLRDEWSDMTKLVQEYDVHRMAYIV